MGMEGENQGSTCRPRLVITHLELENFKSYAGVQRIGPFHKSFSSVVGPNGSGKSNVIDSMLFVFGKRAKQLRLNKVSELIHNSTNFQNLGYARVSVFFQEIVDHVTGAGEADDELFDVVPNSQLTVTRIAFRNNTSKYLLDDKPSNFTEVTDTLKAKGIDLDNNRFLILQGEVEQISMMAPKARGPHDEGLLEYLEDIIGSNTYVEKIEEEAKRLEELNESRSGLVQRLKMTEKERDKLEDAKVEAELYLQKEQELLSWRGVLCQLFLGQTEENLVKIEATKADLNAKLEHEKEKFADFNRRLEEMEGKYGACSKEHAVVQAELERASSEFKEFERKDIKYREDVKHSKQKVKKAEEKRAKAVAKLESSKTQQEDLANEIPGVEESVGDMAKELAKAEVKLDAMQEQLKGEREVKRVELEKAHAQLAPLETEVLAAQSRFEVASAERQLLQDKESEGKRKLQEAKAAKREAEGAITAKELQINQMQAELKENQKKVAAHAEVESQLQQEEQVVSGKVREARARLEERRHAVDSERSQGALMKGLMKAKASGEIPGIFGRLGDLGAIDKEYDVAVSTACGPLDNVVVDTTKTAMACLNYLRTHDLGVATCLILDKQQNLNEEARRAAPETPEGVPRLYDLVRPSDPMFACAWYYALRDTVVAKDLDQASRIAYGGNRKFSRVVTLEGSLIEPSGTMSGGGGRPKGGRMRIGDAPKVVTGSGNLREGLEQAEFELREATADLEDKRRAVAQATKEAYAANKAVTELEMALPKATMELESLRAQVAELSRQLTTLEETAVMGDEHHSQLKSLGKEIAAAEKALNAAQKASEAPAKKVAELQDQMDNLGGEPLRVLKTRVQELHEGIKDSEEEAARKKAQIKTLAAGVKRLEKDIAEAESEKLKLEEKMKELKDGFAHVEEKAAVVLEEFQKTQALQEEKAAELATLKAEFEKVQSDTNTIRTVEVDINSKLEDLERGLKETRDQSRHWEHELKDVRNKLRELANMQELPALKTAEELSEHTEDDAHIQVTMLETALAEMKPDMGSIAEYAKKEEEYTARAEAVDQVTQQRDAVRTSHDNLRKRRLDEFMAGFNAITLKLKEMYQMITLGGDAELELVDSLDPFSEGIVFSVRPPKKSWKNISNLSGGEKTLSSLSLVFALHHYKPTPLYVMDEIDAALDFKNVSIVAHYIKERTKNAQFVIISLRNNMFELADRLVGIYKTDNTTKSVAINPGNFQVGSTQQTSAIAA